MVVLQEKNFSWPAGRRASQNTPKFFQKEKKDVDRFQFFLSYLSEFFIMAINISLEGNSISISQGFCSANILERQSGAQPVNASACEASVENCLLTQHSMAGIDGIEDISSRDSKALWCQ